MVKSKELKEMLDNLSEHDSDLKALGLINKIKRATNCEYFIENILPKLIENNYTINEFNTNSFRITKNTIILDYYPASKKLFDKRFKKWHQNISNDKLIKELEKLINL